MKHINDNPYSFEHELANSITHGVAAALSLAALSLLVVLSSLRGDARHIVSVSIYGVTLFTLYLASTLYHGFSRPNVKAFFHVLDHCSIFLLIAGTYTPFTLVSLRGPWGWSAFGVIWGMALVGIVLKFFFTNRFRFAFTLIYLVMGWLVLALIVPLWKAIGPRGLAWILGGGILYSLGVLFYLIRRVPFHHTIWHLFVLAGSIMHFFAILLHVIPGSR